MSPLAWINSSRQSPRPRKRLDSTLRLGIAGRQAIETESIIREPHVRGQVPLRLLVQHIVVHVREVRDTRRDALGHEDSFGNREMCGMRLGPEAIEDQGVESIEQRKGCFRDLTAIGEVCKAADAESQD